MSLVIEPDAFLLTSGDLEKFKITEASVDCITTRSYGRTLIREIVENDIPDLFVVRPQTRENAMSVEELASIGITPAAMKVAINGSHKGWLFEQDGEVGGFAMGDRNNSELTVMAVLPAHELI